MKTRVLHCVRSPRPLAIPLPAPAASDGECLFLRTSDLGITSPPGRVSRRAVVQPPHTIYDATRESMHRQSTAVPPACVTASIEPLRTWETVRTSRSSILSSPSLPLVHAPVLAALHSKYLRQRCGLWGAVPYTPRGPGFNRKTAQRRNDEAFRHLPLGAFHVVAPLFHHLSDASVHSITTFLLDECLRLDPALSITVFVSSTNLANDADDSPDTEFVHPSHIMAVADAIRSFNALAQVDCVLFQGVPNPSDTARIATQALWTRDIFDAAFPGEPSASRLGPSPR